MVRPLVTLGEMRDLDDIVSEARAGCDGAFRELVERTHGATFTLALRLTGNEHDAADVVQETYLRAYRAIETFRGDSSIGTWLHRITVNCAATHTQRRSRHRHEELVDDQCVVDLHHDHDPERRADTAVLRHSLLDALGRLAPGLRAVVVLRDVYGLSHADLAEELGISVTAAKVRLHRARARLRDLVPAGDGVVAERPAPARARSPRRGLKDAV